MAKRHTVKRRARRVDYVHNSEDHQCALLGMFGFSTKFIQDETGLEEGQITYRLHKAEIRRADYRNGGSGVAEMVLGMAHRQADKELMSHLRSTLSDKDLNIVKNGSR